MLQTMKVDMKPLKSASKSTRRIGQRPMPPIVIRDMQQSSVASLKKT